MIKVVNGFKDGFIGEHTIYIGRGGKGLKQSPLANPFKLNDEKDRQTVIEKYRQWLWGEIKKGENSKAYQELLSISQRVRNGEDVKLACFCKPKACHGDVIKKAVEWINSK